MADKEIYIDNQRVGYATSVEVSPETNTEETVTFDGVITDGTANVSWSVEIEKLRYGKVSDYIKVEQLLHSMMNNPKSVKIIEKVKVPEGVMTVEDIIYDCIVEGKDYSIEADARTVESLSFKGAKATKKVNKTVIY